jgi:serine/threonine protein kinase
MCVPLLPVGMEQPGDMIGRYKLIEPLGQGGFGIVWRAEQSEPIHREVALKVIKPGMDSREIIARFEAERQALALMDHPNIAGVLDAGTTDSGRPFFVMELVKGAPITDYCDAHQVTIRQRLELFIPVCQAVQHAHQKAILHRDLKPSNILVTEVDGKPVPKVIDFGIAKALGTSPEAGVARQPAANAGRGGHRHAAIHESRAGRCRAGPRHPQRHLHTRRHPVTNCSPATRRSHATRCAKPRWMRCCVSCVRPIPSAPAAACCR